MLSVCETSPAMTRNDLHLPARGAAISAITLIAVALALTAAGCGSSSNESPGSASPLAANPVNLADFPQTDGKKTLAEIQREVDAKQNTNLMPAANDFVAGRANRFPFALFNAGRHPLWGPTVMYFATSSTAPAKGPFKATGHNFAIPAKYESATAKSDINRIGNGYYTTTLPNVEGAKKLGVLTLTRTDDGFEAAALPVSLAQKDPAIAPGEKAPAIDTPTGTTPAELEKIDTRRPHDDMHEVSLKDALKQNKPIVLVFATPKLCASRVCAPVTDVAYAVKGEVGDRAIFIHNEIYEDNDLNKGVLGQVKKFGLPSEPFTFVIGRDGRVVQQLQGPFDMNELRAAIEQAEKS